MNDPKHIWAWESCTIVNVDTNPETTTFVEWLDANIPQDIQEFFPGSDSLKPDQIGAIGLSPMKSRRFLVVYELLDITVEPSNACVFSGEYQYRGQKRFFTKDLPIFIALNWYTTGAARLDGLEIHGRIDDEERGRKPVVPELKDALELLKGWIHENYDGNLNILLEGLKWHFKPPITCCESVTGNGDKRQPVKKMRGPDLFMYLPFK